jgi:hypothetical protein
LNSEIAYLRGLLETAPDEKLMQRINRAAHAAAQLSSIDLRIKVAGLSEIKKWTPDQKRAYFMRWYRGLSISDKRSILAELGG